MKKLLTILVALLILTNSCKKYVPAPEAFFIQPSYVNLAITTPSIQGTSSSKITDLFLYVDGKFQGVYQPSNKLPIVTRGQNVKINVLAGIKNNGISETVITWPFLMKLEFDSLVASGKTVNRGFSFQYLPNVTFMWKEDFDGFGVSLIRSAVTATTTSLNLISSPESFESKSAMFELPSNIQLAQFETSVAYPIPHGNPNVYLELNYKCDLKVEIGITDGIHPKSSITLNEKGDWNKIYIQLADALNREPLYDNAKIYFKTVNPNQLNGARVWLDNIKLIYL